MIYFFFLHSTTQKHVKDWKLKIILSNSTYKKYSIESLQIVIFLKILHENNFHVPTHFYFDNMHICIGLANQTLANWTKRAKWEQVIHPTDKNATLVCMTKIIEKCNVIELGRSSKEVSGAVPGKTDKTAVLPQFSHEKYQLVFLTYYLLNYWIFNKFKRIGDHYFHDRSKWAHSFSFFLFCLLPPLT